MAESEGKRRAFVVWDSTARGVKPTLELLQRKPPGGFEVDVLGLDRQGAGAIWRDNVAPKIRAAEVAVALIDLPNANVGFEIGFALGVAGSGGADVKTKRVRLASAAGAAPKWLEQPPFAGQLVASASKKSELEALIVADRSMVIPGPPPPGDGTLLLCPTSGSGEGIGDHLMELRSHWRRPQTEGWESSDLPVVLDGIGRVVWVILSFPGDVQRDGAENAAAAAIAGYALAHGVELRAWHEEDARDVLDVGVHGRKWTTIADLERLLRELDDKAPPAPLDLIDVHRRTLRIMHEDLVPFFAHVTQPLGEVFVELVLDLKPDSCDEDERGRGVMEKLALRELPDGLPSAPTLPALLEVAPNASLSGRYVLLGEPGAGKSTLCRHLCFRLADDQNGPKGSKGPIPVFVSLARLARERSRDVFDLAEEDAAFHCGEDAAKGLAKKLRELAAKGKVWLFLDGLDEVSGETDRSRVRGLIEAFANDDRVARVVATSREVGYDRLGERFVHAKVRPLSDDGSQQRKLLECWLEDERATDVWRRIEESPRVVDLARNPLLLTLLAMIALEDAKLPPSRVKLYARAVRLLLTRGQGRDADGVADEFAAEAILAPLSLRLNETGEDAWSEDDVNRILRELTGQNETVRRDLESCHQTAKQFLREVERKSGIIGGYRGPGEPWRYMHRSLREYLAAKALLDEPEATRLRFLPTHSERDAEKREAMLSRWGETYALLVGLLPNDVDRAELIRRLREKNGADLVLRILPQVEGMAPPVGWSELSSTDGWDGDHLLRMVRGWRFDGHGEDEIRTLLWPKREQTPNVDRLACVHYALTTAPIAFDENRFLAESGLPPRPEPNWIDAIRLPPDGEDHDTFWLGSPEGVGHEWERPRHRVKLTPFGIGKTTVTEAQYAAFDPTHESRKRADFPVVEVSWWNARLFCRWLGGSLPTEAQWEYACRAGSEGQWCFGDDDAMLSEYAWFNKNAQSRVHAVATRTANEFGLHDMHGNVWEWCADWFGPYPGDSPDAAADVAADPAGAPSGSDRVLRGCCCWDGADVARSACRFRWGPGSRSLSLGFRVAFPAPRPRSR